MDASVPAEGRGSHVWPPKEALAGDIYSAQDRVFCSCSSATTQTLSLSQTAVSSIMSSYSVKVTDTPAIKNAPLIGLAEGNGYFSNAQLAALRSGNGAHRSIANLAKIGLIAKVKNAKYDGCLE